MEQRKRVGEREIIAGKRDNYLIGRIYVFVHMDIQTNGRNDGRTKLSVEVSLRPRTEIY